MKNNGMINRVSRRWTAHVACMEVLRNVQYTFYSEKFREGNHFGHLGMGGRVIIGLILNKSGVWDFEFGLRGFVQDPVISLCEHGN